MKTQRPLRLFVDQYGGVFFVRTVKELRHRLGGRVSIMYRDKKDGTTVRTGYVIGRHWLGEYTRVERPA